MAHRYAVKRPTSRILLLTAMSMRALARLLIAANALAAVASWLKQQQLIVEEVLHMPRGIVLSPSTAPPPALNGQSIVRRGLDVDTGQRRLVAQGVIAETDFVQIFSDSPQMAHILAEKRLVFVYPHTSKVVFESDAVRTVVVGVLESPPHKARVELAQTLLEWQEACTAAAALASKPRSIWGWLGDAAGFAVSKAAVADARVESLAGRIKQLRLLLLDTADSSGTPTAAAGSG